MIRLIAVVWTAFLVRVNHVSSIAKPTCISITRKALNRTQARLRDASTEAYSLDRSSAGGKLWLPWPLWLPLPCDVHPALLKEAWELRAYPSWSPVARLRIGVAHRRSEGSLRTTSTLPPSRLVGSRLLGGLSPSNWDRLLMRCGSPRRGPISASRRRRSWKTTSRSNLR
jgi:hypothetical protein